MAYRSSRQSGAHDPGLHDPPAQAHAEGELQEARATRCARGASVRLQGDADLRRAHRAPVLLRAFGRPRLKGMLEGSELQSVACVSRYCMMEDV